MQKIKKNTACSNMTGNRKIFIASSDEIKNIDLVDITTKIVVLKDGHRFGEIEANNIQFHSKEEKGGYIHDISCTLVCTKGKYDTLFDRMKHRRWVIKIEDNNSIVWLAGSLSEPFHFSWEHAGEDQPKGEHCYKLSFYRDSIEPLYTTAL